MAIRRKVPLRGRKGKVYKLNKVKGSNTLVRATALAKMKVPMSIKSYVKRAIDAEAEDKHTYRDIFVQNSVQWEGFDSSIPGRGLTSGSLIPGVLQGTDVEERIGNVIKPKSLAIKYMIVANPLQQGGGGTHPNTLDYNSHAGRDFYVRVVIYNRKDGKNNSSNTHIIDNGSGSTNLIDVEDLYSPYNKDLFNILYSKTIRMAANRWETWSAAGALTNAGTFFSTTGRATSTYNGTAYIKMPSRLMYDDATSTATNFNCFMAVGCINCDDSTIANTEYRADISAKAFLKFQDC